jgi:hypothetical protein
MTLHFADDALKKRRSRGAHAREHGGLKFKVAGFVLEDSGADHF